MGVNLRLVVPLVYAIAVVVAFLVSSSAGTVVAVVGALAVGLFFVFTARSRQRE